MPHVTSPDGTRIGYDLLSRAGPPLVLVSGGLDDGSENLPLAEFLADRFSVAVYRRRGRADSGDTPPYAIERELEDLASVIDAAGGVAAHVFGASTGGALALRAAAGGVPISSVAVYEVPYLIDDELVEAWHGYTAALAAALDAGDRPEALRLFMRLAGSSDDDVAAAEASPVWPGLVELAPTLRYDAACLGDGAPPAAVLAAVTQPVLVCTGATVDPSSPGLPVDFYGAAADAAAGLLPRARRLTVPTVGHVPDPATLGPALAEFYAAPEVGRAE